MSEKKTIEVKESGLGCLGLVLALGIAASLGFCGDSCQAGVVHGVKAIREATR